MPHDHVFAAEIDQHRGAHFAGIGALRMLRNILRAPCHIAAGEQLPGLRQIGVGNADGDIDVQGGDAGAHIAQQCVVALQAAVHLPVTGDEFPAHDSGFLRN
jgi:hypothetical protein